MYFVYLLFQMCAIVFECLWVGFGVLGFKVIELCIQSLKGVKFVKCILCIYCFKWVNVQLCACGLALRS
jgi:hypothetical protein